MKKENIILIVKKHQLFAKVESEKILSLVNSNDTVIKSFNPCEEISSSKVENKGLGIILSGEALVYSLDGTRTVLLRSLHIGDSFGVSTLFNNNASFVSNIVAKKFSNVIFFTPSTIKQLLDECAEFRLSYIQFLSERICFLNQKIACFTAGTPERRLAMFICSKSSEQSFSFALNASALSEMINVGRASLYRAFEKLISDGLISKEGKTITVLNRNELEKIIFKKENHHEN